MTTGQARPVVRTDNGAVRGRIESQVAAFRGIPYAASPVGELRFMPPRPHKGWSGIREAEQAGPAAPQNSSRLELVMGTRTPDWNEDGCLTLNVWTPRGALSDGARRPALLWWHGGGFTSGSGGWDWYDGARLAELGDIVVVTANYRLGALGYLHLPEIGADNLGTQDQEAALRWVHANVAAFGGDPDLITVGGQSAGSFSALNLALAPANRGLIRRIILESGPWGLEPQDPAVAAESASMFLGALGIADAADPGAALRALPIEQLLATHARVSADAALIGAVAPIMYPVLGGAGTPVDLKAAVADGGLAGIDLLVGTTANEMTSFFAFDDRIQNATAEQAVRIAADWFGTEAQALYRRAEAAGVDRTHAKILTRLATTYMFESGIGWLTDNRGDRPAYVYRFDRSSPEDDGLLGAPHCAELPFLFGTFDAYPDSPMLGSVDERARALGVAFGGALAAFVATGSPNGATLAHWAPYHHDTATGVTIFGAAAGIVS
ncbi:MAG TPA: carboxylesterase family protein [Pseudonocardiaceae bacterium]|nr:carboxylesterase family protein [Pseudonocardiaceae bacterium]